MEEATHGQRQVQARLKFTREFAQAARLNRLFWSEFEQPIDGSLVVTFPAPDLDWAASTILAYGPVVEVLDPPELRQRVQAWAQTTINIYGTTSNVVTTLSSPQGTVVHRDSD
jgi:predicted DNA-binding transcriptional regulator YafY